MQRCKVREEFEEQLQRAYTEYAEAKLETPAAARKAQQKIERVISQKHAHERKHRCTQVVSQVSS